MVMRVQNIVRPSIAALVARAKDLSARARSLAYGLPSIELAQITGAEVDVRAPIPDERNMPPRPDLGFLHDDITPLVRIVSSLRPGVVLELGTGRGNATANICAVSDAHVYTVNAPPDRISGETISFALAEAEIGRVYRAHGFAARVTQILENTLDLDLRHRVPEGSVDLAIIDACHDTEYVLNDFSLVRSVLRPGGVVLFHDTHPSRAGHLRGSYDACVQLRRDGYDIRHLRGTWWGVWRDGAYRRRIPGVRRRRFDA